MIRFFLIAFALLFLVACAGDARLAELPSQLLEFGPTLQPTPTLATGAGGPPPTPFVTPWATVAEKPALSEEGETIDATIGPDQATATLAATDTPAATPTSTPTPTPTPQPAERLALGQIYLHNEDFAAAAEQFQASLSPPERLDREQRLAALHGLGLAHLGQGQAGAAINAFNEYLALASAGGTVAETGGSPIGPEQMAAYFHLGEAYQAAGNCQAAIGTYQRYLESNPDTAAYLQPRIAGCHLSLGDRPAAIAAYQAALTSNAHRLTLVAVRQQLAEMHMADGHYATAIAQYDAIHALALTEHTRGQVTYLAGNAEILAGNEEAGYQRYLKAVTDYPRAYDSYRGLVVLVQAGYPVDEFQRGQVNYHARVYAPAVAAFERYLAANPDNYRADTHLYLAWSYEGLGNLPAALQQLDAYLQTNPEDPAVVGEAWIERARMQARAGQTEAAIDTYLEFREANPITSQAPFAAWWAAVLTERQGDKEKAAALYQTMAEAYPLHDDAPEALFRAGLLFLQVDNEEAAVAAWKQAVESYPSSTYGWASIIWLLRSLPTAEALSAVEGEPYLARAAASRGESYYELRARHLADGLDVFQPPTTFDMAFDEAAERSEAEAWLRQWLNLDTSVGVSALSSRLARDPRLVLGEKLWRLGLHNEAKLELEAVRSDYSQNALLSYQLAVYFRDLGLYRSSILAASSVLRLAGAPVSDAPKFLGRLAYPVYYADLILPLAERYGYDPLLQFALVRQESLFESFARSHAAAQGLSQVIPDTGTYIAQRLAWPDYRNELLYRPFVGLAFGAYYLNQQLEAFDGDVYAALSAYNAGPGNAARWYRVAPQDPDLYVETVNFAETRLYIERIYVGHAVYRYLYGSEE